MTIIEGFYDEVGFFESKCSSIEWKDDTLIFTFSSGVSLGGSDHPLAESFAFESPCKIVIEGVIKSKLFVSQFISHPNIFEDHYFEKNDLPSAKAAVEYFEYYLEGAMMATVPTGWFTWDIVAERFYFDDLKK